MTDQEGIAQSIGKQIEVQPTAELAERRSRSMRALAALAGRMTLRAHAFGESLALLLERALLGALPERGRCSEQQDQEGYPYDHDSAETLLKAEGMAT